MLPQIVYTKRELYEFVQGFERFLEYSTIDMDYALADLIAQFDTIRHRPNSKNKKSE